MLVALGHCLRSVNPVYHFRKLLSQLEPPLPDHLNDFYRILGLVWDFAGSFENITPSTDCSDGATHTRLSFQSPTSSSRFPAGCRVYMAGMYPFSVCKCPHKYTSPVRLSRVKIRYESESVYASDTAFGWSRKVFQDHPT